VAGLNHLIISQPFMKGCSS